MVYFADVSAASYVDHMLTHHTVVSAVMLAHTTLISWQDFKQVWSRKLISHILSAEVSAQQM